MRIPGEQEDFLEHKPFANDRRALLRDLVPHSRLLRSGLTLIAVGAAAFLAVVVSGGGLEDTGPLLTTLIAAGSVSLGILLCMATSSLSWCADFIPDNVPDTHARADYLLRLNRWIKPRTRFRLRLDWL